MAANRPSLARGFRRVDDTSDPEAFVRAMDQVRGMAVFLAVKQRSYALCDLRPGQRVLDVGTGPGDDARALAERVTPGGHVLGIDSSQSMVEEARHRSAGTDLPVEFCTGDVRALELDDASFDAVRAERLLIHVPETDAATAELVRVARPGAPIVLVDIDGDMWSVNVPPKNTTRRLMNFAADNFASPWIGRDLFGLMRRHGLQDVDVLGDVACLTDYELANASMQLDTHLDGAVATGVVTDREATEWRDNRDRVVESGCFVGMAAIYTAVGRKPAV